LSFEGVEFVAAADVDIVDEDLRHAGAAPGAVHHLPPPGRPHRYVFKLYALGTKLDLPPKKTAAEIEQAMKGHVLAEARLTGSYGR